MARSVKLPDAHRLVRTRKDKVVIYWQAWRGGPSIGKFEGRALADAERAEAAGADQLADRYAQAKKTVTPKDIVAGLITAYRAADDGYKGLSAGTQETWGKWLDAIRDEFGDLPVAALKARGMKRQIIAWRGQWAATPRKADIAVQVIRRLFNWAIENELADANPALGIPELYTADRSDVIVEPHQLAAILPHLTPPAARYVRLAAYTGIRRGDLRALRWDQVSETSIELGTKKSRGRSRILVPLLPEAQAVLAEAKAAEDMRCAKLRKRGVEPIRSPFVLTTRAGNQWSKDGPTGMWIIARNKVLPGSDLHLHDLRGTFATMLMIALPELSDDSVGEILGWNGDDVARIRRRYVDRERIAISIIERLAARKG